MNRTGGDECEDGNLLPNIINNGRPKFFGCPWSTEERVA